MNDLTQTAGRKRRGWRFWGLCFLAVFCTTCLIDNLWERSGSNEWKLVSDANEMRVWSLKTPGNSLLKYRVKLHLDAELSDIVFFLTDLQSGADVGAYDIDRLEQVSTPRATYVYDTYKVKLPWPIGVIEAMIINLYTQDPQTRQVNISIYAAPNKKPRDARVTRVVHLSNSWIITPLESGGVDVESVSEMDLGVPYVLANLAMPGVLADEVNKMRTVIKTDRYRNGRPAFIRELHEDAHVAGGGQQPAALTAEIRH